MNYHNLFSEYPLAKSILIEKNNNLFCIKNVLVLICIKEFLPGRNSSPIYPCISKLNSTYILKKKK